MRWRSVPSEIQLELMEPIYQSWNLGDRLAAIRYLDIFEDPEFKACQWILPEPVEKDGKMIHSLGYPEYDPRVYEFLRLAWHEGNGIDPYVGEPWEQFWVRHCIDPSSFADASVGDIRRYLMLLSRRERFGDGTIDTGFRNGVVLAALRRLVELTPEANQA